MPINDHFWSIKADAQTSENGYRLTKSLAFFRRDGGAEDPNFGQLHVFYTYEPSFFPLKSGRTDSGKW